MYAPIAALMNSIVSFGINLFTKSILLLNARAQLMLIPPCKSLHDGGIPSKNSSTVFATLAFFAAPFWYKNSIFEMKEFRKWQISGVSSFESDSVVLAITIDVDKEEAAPPEWSDLGLEISLIPPLLPLSVVGFITGDVCDNDEEDDDDDETSDGGCDDESDSTAIGFDGLRCSWGGDCWGVSIDVVDGEDCNDETLCWPDSNCCGGGDDPTSAVLCFMENDFQNDFLMNDALYLSRDSPESSD